MRAQWCFFYFNLFWCSYNICIRVKGCKRLFGWFSTFYLSFFFISVTLIQEPEKTYWSHTLHPFSGHWQVSPSLQIRHPTAATFCAHEEALSTHAIRWKALGNGDSEKFHIYSHLIETNREKMNCWVLKTIDKKKKRRKHFLPHNTTAWFRTMKLMRVRILF